LSGFQTTAPAARFKLRRTPLTESRSGSKVFVMVMTQTPFGSRLAVLALASVCSTYCLAAGASLAPQAPQHTFQLPGGPGFVGRPKAQAFGLDGPNFKAPYGDDKSAGIAAAAPDAADDQAEVAQDNEQSRSPGQGDDDPDVVRQRLLDTLFQRLKTSSDNEEAEGIADAIERVWFDSGSDTADLLMARALIAEKSNNYPVGRELLGKIVEIDPNWAEAWNELAVTRVLANDEFGAMDDIAHALALEPRHFGALAGLGALLLKSGDKKGALQVFRRVLQLYPRLDPVRSIVDRLTIQVDGRDL
jgi:tetratricopeptide (TPR) repeat protein